MFKQMYQEYIYIFIVWPSAKPGVHTTWLKKTKTEMYRAKTFGRWWTHLN